MRCDYSFGDATEWSWRWWGRGVVFNQWYKDTIIKVKMWRKHIYYATRHLCLLSGRHRCWMFALMNFNQVLILCYFSRWALILSYYKEKLNGCIAYIVSEFCHVCWIIVNFIHSTVIINISRNYFVLKLYLCYIA